MKKNIFLKFTLLVTVIQLFAIHSYTQSIRFDQELFSTAGFHKLKDSDSRMVFSFNNGWYFYKGDMPGAQKENFRPTGDWKQVQLPHGIDILPEEASGGVNYQGIVWYRKNFTLPKEIKGKKLSLTFEAIMGTSKIWLNGKLITEHKGGYLPIVIDLTKNIKDTGLNTIAIMADNTNDASYPPGKPEYILDFNYLGGIYRDAWLVATNDIHITDANEAGKIAGGGVLVHYENVSAQSANVIVQTDIANENTKNQPVFIETFLEDAAGKVAGKISQQVLLKPNSSKTVTQNLHITNPGLWSPDEPSLYRLYTIVKNSSHGIIDGYYQNIGIRSIELHGSEGLYLNGKPFNDKLIGANHHQDYAIIGNAVSNNLHWHDAKLMRDAGIRIVRGSHYPQDPAFMDACDQLGIFVIVCTPGWQFWNNDSSFVNGIYNDVRQMIRRDRNHPSVFAWEPVPNETGYPKEFAQKVYAVTHAEYPFKDCIAAANAGSALSGIFDLLYSHPGEYTLEQKKLNDPNIANSPKGDAIREELQKPFFTREWGDNVENWNAQNSDSRVARSWGEIPQLVQAIHYSNPDSASRNVNVYGTSWETLYESPARHIGGALWHFFDTQRGYHPDPFYGGLADGFRQTKYAYYLFKSQQNPMSPYFKLTGENPYTLFIANELTPFSPADIPVFTNCDSVQLTVFGKYSITQKPEAGLQMPHPPVIFKNTFYFRDIQKSDLPQPTIEAKGFKNGQVVIVIKKIPAFRPAALKLSTDIEPAEMLADGSTVIPVTVSLTDEFGNIKRLNKQADVFSVEGEGRLINNPEILENPKKIEWGTGVALIKTNLTAGRIKIMAMPLLIGSNTVKGDTLIINTIPPVLPSVYEQNDASNLEIYNTPTSPAGHNTNAIDAAKQKEQLKKVEEDQKKFQTNQHN